MPLHLRCPILLAAALLVSAARTTHAQDTSSATRGQFLLGAGGALSSGSNASPSVLVGRVWQENGSRLGFRLTGDFTSSSNSGALFDYNTFSPNGSFDIRSRSVTLGGAMTFDLTRSAVRPYLISGFTLQRVVRRDHLEATNGMLVDENGVQGNVADYHFDGVNVGLQGGVGLSVRVRRLTVFGEARTFVPITGTGPVQGRIDPLTFGIRF